MVAGSINARLMSSIRVHTQVWRAGASTVAVRGKDLRVRPLLSRNNSSKNSDNLSVKTPFTSKFNPRMHVQMGTSPTCCICGKRPSVCWTCKVWRNRRVLNIFGANMHVVHYVQSGRYGHKYPVSCLASLSEGYIISAGFGNIVKVCGTFVLEST